MKDFQNDNVPGYLLMKPAVWPVDWEMTTKEISISSKFISLDHFKIIKILWELFKILKGNLGYAKTFHNVLIFFLYSLRP